MPPADQGRGKFVLPDDYKLVRIPRCTYCKQLDPPDCKCGRPKLYEKR